MSTIELKAEPLQVELIGDQHGIRGTLKVDGVDISDATRSIDIHVPADGLVEARVTLIPRPLLADLKIEAESITLYMEGVNDLLRASLHAIDAMKKGEGFTDVREDLRAAIDRLELGI